MAKTKMTLRYAKIVSKGLIEALSPYCVRIEEAGSIRREKAMIGDIELVAIPKPHRDMLGFEVGLDVDHELNYVDWSKFGKITLDGNKQKKIVLTDGTNVDLFIVTPPAQWGVIFMLRTGSAEFSHRMVTTKQHGGLMPSNLRSHEGAIRKGDTIIETPEEQDLFKILGVDYIEPKLRVK